MKKSIILFDSDCLPCSALVRFLMKRDNGRFYYDSLNLHYEKYRSFDSIVVLPSSETPLLIRSRAVFYIIHSMNYPWKILLFLKIIPRPILDLAYRLIAKLRHLINIKNRPKNRQTVCLVDVGISKSTKSKILK